MPAPQASTAGGPVTMVGPARSGYGLQVARVAGIPILLAPSVALVVAVLAVVLAPLASDRSPGLGGGAYAVGAALGLVIYLAVLAHEAAHALVARRFGHTVVSITLSAMGGRTTMRGEPRSPGEELVTAVVGPLASLLVGAVALALSDPAGPGLLGLTCELLAVANLLVGLLDLVPAPPLDGGRVVLALGWWLSGSPRRGAEVSAWCGRVLAVALVAVPLVAVLVQGRTSLYVVVTFGALGLLLWLAAGRELTVVRLRRRIDELVAGRLARPAVTADPAWTVQEALAVLGDDPPRLVTVDADHRVIGVVDGAALAAVPAADRDRTHLAGLTRTSEAGGLLPADLAGEQLVGRVSRDPRPEYALVDRHGRSAGVLCLADLDQLLGRR